MVGDEFSSKIIGVPRVTKMVKNTSSPWVCVIFVKILVFSLELERFVLKMLPTFSLHALVRSVYVTVFLDSAFSGTRIAKITGCSDIFLFI